MVIKDMNKKSATARAKYEERYERMKRRAPLYHCLAAIFYFIAFVGMLRASGTDVLSNKVFCIIVFSVIVFAAVVSLSSIKEIAKFEDIENKDKLDD